MCALLLKTGHFLIYRLILTSLVPLLFCTLYMFTLYLALPQKRNNIKCIIFVVFDGLLFFVSPIAPPRPASLCHSNHARLRHLSLWSEFRCGGAEQCGWLHQYVQYMVRDDLLEKSFKGGWEGRMKTNEPSEQRRDKRVCVCVDVTWNMCLQLFFCFVTQ